MFVVGMFKLSDLGDFYNKDPEYCSNRLLLKPCDCFYAPNGLEKVEAMVNGICTAISCIRKDYLRS